MKRNIEKNLQTKIRSICIIACRYRYQLVECKLNAYTNKIEQYNFDSIQFLFNSISAEHECL